MCFQLQDAVGTSGEKSPGIVKLLSTTLGKEKPALGKGVGVFLLLLFWSSKVAFCWLRGGCPGLCDLCNLI